MRSFVRKVPPFPYRNTIPLKHLFLHDRQIVIGKGSVLYRIGLGPFYYLKSNNFKVPQSGLRTFENIKHFQETLI